MKSLFLYAHWVKCHIVWNSILLLLLFAWKPIAAVFIMIASLPYIVLCVINGVYAFSKAVSLMWFAVISMRCPSTRRRWQVACMARGQERCPVLFHSSDRLDLSLQVCQHFISALFQPIYIKLMYQKTNVLWSYCKETWSLFGDRNHQKYYGRNKSTRKTMYSLPGHY